MAEDSFEYEWMDDDAGPVVRPYTVSGGRTQHTGRYDVLAFVKVTGVRGDDRELQPEHQRILDRAREPVSVAELGAHLDLALGVVRVLLGDLEAKGLIVIKEPVDGADRPAADVLEAVIDGLRAL
jgi:hypothetical protein